jgi:hypothetical protein
MDKCITHYFSKIGLLLLLSTTCAFAQKKYGNEWIDTTQAYLRIPVVETGFYKITSNDLRKTGFPVDPTAFTSLQLFRRGKEVAIEVNNKEGKSGLEIDICFYGERNDGALDSLLYVTPGAMPHPFYSLYSDTAAYFLTYQKDGTAGKRIQISDAKTSDDFTSYHFHEVLQLLTDEYPAGNLYPMGSNYDNGTALTTYDTGEGWTGKALFNNQSETLRLPLENPVPRRFEQAEIALLLVGRSAEEHRITVVIGDPKTNGRKPDTLTLSDYQSALFKIPLSPEDISADRKLTITVTPVSNTGLISVSYVKWRYPQQISLPATGSQKIFSFDKTLPTQTAIIKNEQNWQFYDCSDPYNLKKINPRDTLLSLNGASQIIASKDFLSLPAPRLVKFKPVNPTTNYLIISHPLVRNAINGSTDPVRDYADYRASSAGRRFHPVIFNSEEIFDQFNYGEPGPLGIRNAISFLHKNTALQFVLLLGKSIDPQTARHQSKARQNDMIPNAGWPGSDVALTMALEDSSVYIPLVPIGRVNAATAQNVFDYLQKVEAFEAQSNVAEWRKNILHLSGGHSVVERETFREYVESFEKRIRLSSLGANIRTISKKTDELVELFPIDTIANRGIAFMTLYGHSGLSANDIDIGTPSAKNRNYKNAPFYPAILVNGCAMGNIYYSTPAISNDWILAPDKGAVLFLAHTHNGITSSLKHYSDAFYDVLADSLFVSEAFGVIQQEAIRRNIAKYPTLSDGITAQQMNLLGDPAIRIFPARLPDYTWNQDFLQLSDPAGKALTIQSDSLKIKIGIRNLGRFRDENYKISIRRVNDNRTYEYTFLHPATSSRDTLVLRLPNSGLKSGTEKWHFTIDPDQILKEENEGNNSFETEFILPQSNDSEPAQITDAGVSPNPSNYQFRFVLYIDGLILPEKWTVSVFNNQGTMVYQQVIQCHLGKNEHIWNPMVIPPGAYIYRIEPDKNFRTSSQDVQNRLSGKIIWMH